MPNLAYIDQYLKPIDVHEVRRARPDGLLAYLIVGICVLVAEGMTFYLMLWEHIGVALGVILHLIVTGIAAAYARSCLRSAEDARFPVLLALTTGFLGPYGAAGSIVAMLLHLWYLRHAHSFQEWFNTIFPSLRVGPTEEIYEDILSGRDESPLRYSVIPFLDVIALGSDAQKRQAISKMTASFHPSFATAFKRALQDPSNAIRVQAATAISKVENAFLEQAIRIERVLRLRPKDADVKLAQARHFDNYAYTGILDPEREAANREAALDAYMAYLAMKPQSLEARLYIGRTLKRSGRISEAAQWFKKCIDEGNYNDAMVTWYLECLFELGRFRELRETANHFQPRLSLDQRYQLSLVESIRLWSGQGGIATVEGGEHV